MRTMPDWLVLVCRVVLIIGIPIVLTLTNVRLLMTHTFPQIEYGLPDFPADPYGFTTEDRLYWAQRSIDYILGDPAVGRAEAWKFSDDGRAAAGTQAPPESCGYYGDQYGARDCTYFYNDREVRHMVDVRNVTAAVLNVWVILGVLTLSAVGMLIYAGQTATLRWGLLTGAGLAWVLLIVAVLFIALGFQQFFTYFHQVFFQGDSWIFLWSDSLIRLFPLKFWFDAFLFVGLSTLAEAALVAALAWWAIQ